MLQMSFRRMKKPGSADRPASSILTLNINPAFQAESPVGPGCHRSTEAVRPERTWGSHRTFAEYTPERVRNTCKIPAHVAHRHPMPPQTSQAQQRHSQQGPGFCSYSLLLFPPSKLPSLVGKTRKRERLICCQSVSQHARQTRQAACLPCNTLGIRSDAAIGSRTTVLSLGFTLTCQWNSYTVAPSEFGRLIP